MYANEQHTLSVLVSNKAGVLSKVTALFARRGFNIESLAVGPTEDKNISRITIIANGDDYIIEQLTKQLNKLIDVIKVKNLSNNDTVSKELALIKVTSVDAEKRKEILQMCEIYHCKVVDVSLDALIIEITGTLDKVNAFIDICNNFGKLEVVRTGTVSIERGSKTVEV